MPVIKLLGSIFHHLYAVFLSDMDSCIITFIGAVHMMSFALGVDIVQIVIEPVSILEHADKILNLLITIFSLLILIRKYKKQNK